MEAHHSVTMEVAGSNHVTTDTEQGRVGTFTEIFVVASLQQMHRVDQTNDGD